MNEAVFYNVLALQANGSYGTLELLWQRFKSWSKAYEAVGRGIAFKPEAEWQRLERLGVKLILREDPSFPALLKEISSMPFGLYYRGAKIGPEAKIAIVGTRRASTSGTTAARKLAAEIAAAGVTIVSGLAFGIDVASHTGALEVGGQAIAVLASGCNLITPQTNRPFGEKILNQGGTILSEYPLDCAAKPERFLERNRIVSGLSKGILIIEAPIRSGTQATARFAIEQNREVFVVPGSITDSNFEGSHELLKQGATLVTSSQDVLASLGIEPVKKAQQMLRGAANQLTPEEHLILAALAKKNIPLHSDAIVAQTSLPESVVHQTLTVLVVQGLITETAGRYLLV